MSRPVIAQFGDQQSPKKTSWVMAHYNTHTREDQTTSWRHTGHFFPVVVCFLLTVGRFGQQAADISLLRGVGKQLRCPFLELRMLTAGDQLPCKNSQRLGWMCSEWRHLYSFKASNCLLQLASSSWLIFSSSVSSLWSVCKNLNQKERAICIRYC